MGKRRKTYSEELQKQLVRLARSGRTPEDLGREFEPSAQSIRTGSSRPSSMKVAAPTDSRRMSVMSWCDCVERMRG
jgi:hypothetical protein